MRVCTVEGCGSKHVARGFCARHYSLATRNGTLKRLPASTCSEPGCDAVVYRANLCATHKRRARANGTLDTGKVCSVKGCERTLVAYGLCQMHRRRQVRGRPMIAALLREPCPDDCTFAGCGKKAIAKGLCTGHWTQKNRGSGELTELRKRGQKWKNQWGYVMVAGHQGHPNANANGAIAEHRLVMSRELGRPLTDTERVHHKNGDRSDNRPENLELWNTSQPSGQRVEDKVQWAIEILKLYQPEALSDGFDGRGDIESARGARISAA